MKYLLERGLLHGDAMTVTGELWPKTWRRCQG